MTVQMKPIRIWYERSVKGYGYDQAGAWATDVAFQFGNPSQLWPACPGRQ